MTFNLFKHRVCMIDSRYTGVFSEIIYKFLIAVSVVVMVALLILLIVRIALRLDTLRRDMKYLNMEIRRTKGAEQKYWKKQKHRLWLSVIPFCKR